MFSDLLPDRFEGGGCCRVESPASIFLCLANLAQDSPCAAEQPYERDRNSPAPSVARTRRRSPAHPAPTQGPDPRSRPCPHRSPGPIVAPFGPSSALQSPPVKRRHHLQTRHPRPIHIPHQPVFSAISAICHPTPLWNRDALASHGLNFATLLHGVPVAVGVLRGTPRHLPHCRSRGDRHLNFYEPGSCPAI